MWPHILLLIYCVLIALASLLGGWLPSWLKLTHTRMQLMMSFVGGLMMGVAILHLLPHAVIETNSLDQALWATVLGMLTMFFMIRAFHVHQHVPGELKVERAASKPPEYGHPHAHEALCRHSPEIPELHRLSWVGLFAGLALHTLIDGIALAASVRAGISYPAAFGLLGLGTFLAIVLHKPLDSLSILSVMIAGGWSAGWKHAVNVAFALLCPLGALAFYFGVSEFAAAQHLIIGWALGFAAGVFLCIALADILPEIQFHTHDRLKLSAALLLGVLLAAAIGFLEPEHAHDHDHPHDSHSHSHP